jgi:hypothetical protein
MTTSTEGSTFEELIVSTRDLVLESKPSVRKIRKTEKWRYTHFEILPKRKRVNVKQNGKEIEDTYTADKEFSRHIR